MVYLARRNAVARVGQTMAWVRCALWREGRWWEIGVIRVVRRFVGLLAWGERTVGTAVGRVHRLWHVGGCGPSWDSCATAVWCGGLGCVGDKMREK